MLFQFRNYQQLLKIKIIKMNTFNSKQIKKNSNKKLSGNNLKKHYISNNRKNKNL